ncbi:hypothetical protein BGZ75_001905 [Mortierella antarctica]|nr:hypothetical protein BGZ75_001905 [Mortierella antarctica]
MSDKELLAQIAQVAGKCQTDSAINKHLNTPATPAYTYSSQPSFRGGYNGYNGYSARGRGRGRGGIMPPTGAFNRKLTLNNTSTAPSAPANSTPVMTAPVVGPPVRPPVPSRHLSLVNRNTVDTSTSITASSQVVAPSSSSPTSASSTPSPTSGQQWIQSKGKNMSLMNPATFKKTMDAKEKSIRTSKEAKQKLRVARAQQAANLRKGVVTVGGQQYTKSRDGRKLVMRDSTKDNIVINGVSFQMDPKGNKLVRKGASRADASSRPPAVGAPVGAGGPAGAVSKAAMPSATPKQFAVDGVVYVRTTNGNLVRATLVKNKLLAKRAAQEELKQKRAKAAPKRSFCKFYTRFANGGIRVKKSAEEIEKEKQNGSESVSNAKRRRVDPASSRRYMDGQRQRDQDSDQDQEQDMDGSKGDRDFDENFIPLDLGDDFDEEVAMLLDQQDDIQESDGHGQDKEAQVDDDEGDVSSDGVESDEDGVNDEVSAADVASEEDQEDPEDEDEDDDENEGGDQDEYEVYQNQYEEDEDQYEEY